MFTRTAVVATLSFCVTVACGAGQTPGTQPHDMSAAEHDRLAREEQGAAQAHAAQFAPDAGVIEPNCSDVLGRDICWASATNPTKEHVERAEEHRKRAAEHRAASAALRDAEARACAGIAAHDRDESPFDHREDIAAVSPIYASEGEPGSSAGAGYVSGARGQRLEGANVTFRAVPGMTAQWLQRTVDCHLARNAALGHDVAEMAYCPLVPKGVSAKVSGTTTGFAVALRSDDPNAAREIVRRAQALLSR